jgi:hypothetical protein
VATPRTVVDHYAAQRRLQLATVAAVRAQWARMSTDFDQSWTGVSRRIVLLIGAGQLGSARAGAAYIDPTLAELGTPPVEPVGRVVASAFVGIASDGRSLDDLAYETVIHAKSAIGRGATVPVALQKAGGWLSTMVSTQLADSARGAAGVAITTRPTIGYVRMLSPPSCSRCAILAGAYYRFNAGFERHLNCDCKHIPCREDAASDLRTDPDAYFKSLDRVDQDKTFTKDGAEAIRDGADIYRVVNARLPTAAGGVRGGRVMPDHIYARATDRDDAIRLLAKFGYIR